MSITSSLAAQPALQTDRLQLVQLGPDHLDATLASLEDADAMRLTGTRGAFTRDQVREHLRRLPGADDRADFAILDEAGAYLGEVVLNDLAEEDRAMNYRIALAGPAVRGRGYGTEAGRAVVAWAFDEVGLHRVSLDVFLRQPRRSALLREDRLPGRGPCAAHPAVGRRVGRLGPDGHAGDRPAPVVWRACRRRPSRGGR